MTCLHGKTAFISGGSRGIGLAIAQRFAKDGVNLMISASNQAHLEVVANDLQAHSTARVSSHSANLRSLAGCETAFAAHQEEYSVCDILIHSAGATKGGIFPTQPDEDFSNGFALKFHAGVRLSRLFWPRLKLAKGHVIMIVGGAARTPDHTFMVGSSVNAALANYSKALAGQGLLDDVNVNWISPGQTETSRLQNLLARRAEDEGKTVEAVRQERIQNEGIRRLGRPEDIAELVCFLCGDKSRHIHGAGIAIDGGATKGYF